MDTRLLDTFLAVARHGSFTAAAAQLHLVQSTVTSRIKSLEKFLGTELFERLPDGVRLTETAQRVAGHAHDVLDAERLLIGSAVPRAAPAGDVVLGAPESMCAYRLPQVISELRQTHPDVNVHLVPAGTHQTFAGLLDRTIDVGIVLDDRTPPRHLRSEKIGREHVDLVAAPDHAVARDGLDWVRLAEFTYFLLEEGCSYSDRFLQDLVDATGGPPQVTRFGSIEATRACVASGLGLSVLPRIATATTARDALVRLSWPPRPAVDLMVLVDERRRRSPATSAVRHTLRVAARAWQADM